MSEGSSERDRCTSKPPSQGWSADEVGRVGPDCYEGGLLFVALDCSPIASAEAPASIRRRMSLRLMSC